MAKAAIAAIVAEAMTATTCGCICFPVEPVERGADRFLPAFSYGLARPLQAGSQSPERVRAGSTCVSVTNSGEHHGGGDHHSNQALVQGNGNQRYMYPLTTVCYLRVLVPNFGKGKAYTTRTQFADVFRPDYFLRGRMGAVVCRSPCRLSGSSQSAIFPAQGEAAAEVAYRPMGLISWFSLFNFSWWRRCKSCGARGAKCLCRRPSLALEHIFFLEERKNKFGARNFSHVSDSMMTSNSTMMTSNSTMFASSNTTNNNLSNSTVLLRGNGDSDLNPADYYYGNGAVPPSNASDDSAELSTPIMDRKHQTKRHRSGSRRGENNSALQNEAPTALVRKQSRRMMSKARHKGDKNMQPPIKEIVTGEYILYAEENTPVSLPMRQQQQIKQVAPRRRTREQSKSVKVASRPQYKEEPGVTYQFYGRSGSGRGGAPVPQLSSNRSISMSSSCSTNDSFAMRSASISSTRASQFSDRVSLETNFGSINPQSTMNSTGAGRFIDSGYAPSIQEDDEAQALEQLNGWLNASSVSTNDSFMYSR